MKKGIEKRSRWVEEGKQDGCPSVMSQVMDPAAQGDPTAKLSV